MHRKTLLTSTFALLLAGSTSFAVARAADALPAPPAPPVPAAMPDAPIMQHGPMMPGPGGIGDRGPRGGLGMRGDDQGVIADLRGLEHLYREAGRSKELPALYNEVLAKSQDPRVRAYAYQHLAWVQAQPTNLDASIATLRKSLNENLANEAKHHEAMEKMRARWEQRHAKDSAASAN
jgi:hypothetical protein